MLLRITKTTTQHLRSASPSLWLIAKRCTIRKQHTNSLISCEELFSMVEDPNNCGYRVLDARWDLEGRDYSLEHLECRIPGSKYFDLEVCRDVASPYKMMLPSAQHFQEYVRDLGVSNDHHVVIYDDHSKHAVFSAPRLWWMFHTFGHSNVSILNGGLTSWMKLGHPHTSGPYTADEDVAKGDFKATLNEDLVRDFNFVKGNPKSCEPVQLLESRGLGTLPHTVEGDVDLTTSSVPCAVWTPFDQLLDPHTRSIRNPDEICEFFSANGVDLSSFPVTTCGRGVSASIVTFCAYYATGTLLPVYDGSWSEWSAKVKL